MRRRISCISVFSFLNTEMMFCEFVVIGFLSWVSVADQMAFIGQHHPKSYREFLAVNEWLLTYRDSDRGLAIINHILDQKSNDSQSPIDYVECLQPDRHTHQYR